MDFNGDFPVFFWPFFGVIAFLAFAGLAFDIWMLVDAIQRSPQEFSSPDAKTWWIVGLIVGLVTGLPALAVALAYFFVVRQPAQRRGPAPTHAAAGATSGTAPPSAAPTMPPIPAPPTNCRNCGAKLVAGSRFCHSCGAPTT